MKDNSNNKGYSLVELIIVIAIIAIVSTMSILSVTVLFSAKVKADSQSFNSELGLLKENRFAVPVDTSGTKYEGKYNALKLYKSASDGRLYVQKCIYDPVTGNVTSAVADTRNGGNGLRLTSYTSVSFAEQNSGSVVNVDGSNSVIIVYDRDGTVHLNPTSSTYVGAGKFIFKKRNGDTVANVFLRGNGSHNVK